MRDHPIPPVTEPLQYRAIGLVRGKYIPNDSNSFSRGLIVDEKGEQIEAVVLGRAFGLIKRYLSIDSPHLWVVYPRCRNSDQLHLQITGIWEPSTLGKPSGEKNESENNKTKFVKGISDKVEEGDDYFSIRGELVYTKPETKDLILKIRQKPRDKKKKSFPFKLNLKGEIPITSLRNFVSLDVRRSGQKLYVEGQEIIGPVKTRSYVNKALKNSRLKNLNT